MARTFSKQGVDPDVQIYNDFLEREDARRQKDGQYALKRRRTEPPVPMALPEPKVSASILRFQWTDTLASCKPKRNAPTRGTSTSTGNVHKTREAQVAEVCS